VRFRPDVALFLKPAVAIAGDEVLVEAVLKSRSDTPVDGITMTLRGAESAGYQGRGAFQRSIVAQRAAFGPRKLQKGDNRVSARFPIPHDAPPSYRGTLLVIDYELELEVTIPWWLDRRQKFVIPVSRRAAFAEQVAPKVYCNRQRTADALYMETTLDDERIEQDGVLTGVVSFANVSSARIKRVELQFKSRESIGPAGGVPLWHLDGAAYVSTILDRAPKEGEPAHFRVKFPRDAAMTFRSEHGRVEWTVSLVAVLSFGDDVSINIPVKVLPPSRTGRQWRRAELPPVGRERRAKVLQAAAQRLELDFDSAREELRSTAASSTISIRLEPHEGRGLVAVTELVWPALGLDLELRERRWTDAFADELSIDDVPFRKRFHVSAKEKERASLVLDSDVRSALSAFTEVELDDEGAMLARPISVQSVETVMQDLEPTLAAARCLAEAAARVAPTMGYR
jgi:hypothetical protein